MAPRWPDRVTAERFLAHESQQLNKRPRLYNGTFTGPGKRDYMLQTTATRAQENLCYAMSANQVGGSDGAGSYAAGRLDEGRAADFLGHSVIAGPAFPRFNQIYAEAGDGEELVTATLSFEKLHRWESIFPWRDWRATPTRRTWRRWPTRRSRRAPSMS